MYNKMAAASIVGTVIAIMAFPRPRGPLIQASETYPTNGCPMLYPTIVP